MNEELVPCGLTHVKYMLTSAFLSSGLGASQRRIRYYRLQVEIEYTAGQSEDADSTAIDMQPVDNQALQESLIVDICRAALPRKIRSRLAYRFSTVVNFALEGGSRLPSTSISAPR